MDVKARTETNRDKSPNTDTLPQVSGISWHVSYTLRQWKEKESKLGKEEIKVRSEAEKLQKQKLQSMKKSCVSERVNKIDQLR